MASASATLDQAPVTAEAPQEVTQGVNPWIIAASVMFCGVLILYLPLSAIQAMLVTALTLAGMTLALYLTRHESVEAVTIK